VDNGKTGNKSKKDKGNEQGIEIIEDKHMDNLPNNNNNNNAPSNTPRNHKKSITKSMSKISRLS